MEVITYSLFHAQGKVSIKEICLTISLNSAEGHRWLQLKNDLVYT